MAVTLLGREQREQREHKRIFPIKREKDKRYFPRWEVTKRVEYIEEGRAAFQSYTRDLCLDGASILVFGDPPERHRVQLRIFLEEEENFETQGRIAWSKREPTHKLFGIIFEDLSNKAQELIMRHAFELREEHLLTYRFINEFNAKRRLFSPEIFSSASGAIPSAAASAGWAAERRAFPRYILRERAVFGYEKRGQR